MTSLILFKSDILEIFELSFLEAFSFTDNFETEFWHMLQNKVQINNKKSKHQIHKPTQNPEIFKVCSNWHERAAETRENKSSIWKTAHNVENLLIL